MEELIGDRHEPMRASESVKEINLTMQQRRAPDTSEPRGKEVDEESESSISTSSSSARIPPDSPKRVIIEIMSLSLMRQLSIFLVLPS